MVSNPIAHARLIELLHYDQATGVFTRKVTTGYRGGRHKAGTIAGSRPKLGRYQDIKVDGVMYRAHRLAWFYVTSKWPEHEIDHKDTIKTHNWFDNLREASDAVNSQNMRKARRDSKTGILGVSWSAARSKFVAQIQVNKEKIGLGDHDTAEAAHAAYVTAKRQLHEGNTL